MKRFIAIFAALFVMLSVFTGCAKNASDMDIGDSDSYNYKTEVEVNTAETMDVVEDDMAEEPSNTEAGFSGIDSETSRPVQERKIIYTMEYYITTENYEEDYQKILSATEAAGGYLSGENTYGTVPEEYGDNGRHSNLTLRIPIENYESFLDAVSGIGTIENKTQSTEDVTTEYYDNEARIEFYEAHYKKLMEYLEKATEMEDILSIEAQITETLYTLDSLKGNRSYYDNMTQYTTVSIYLDEQVRNGTVVTSKSSLGDRISESFTGAIKSMGIFFEEFLIILTAVIPWLIPIAVIFCAIFFPIRRYDKKKRAALRAQKDIARQKKES